MKTDIWMPWYPSDYLRDTMSLSLEEDAVYRRALDSSWVNPGLPTDPERIRRILRVNESEWARCAWVMDEFFFIRDGKYFHKRIQIEKDKADLRADRARKNGELGGRPPKNNPEITQPVSRGFEKHNPGKSSSPSPSPSESQSSSKKETTLSSKLDSEDSPVAKIFNVWKVKLNHPQAILDAKRKKAVEARLKEGFTVDRILSAIDGIMRCPHNMGKNERNTKYDDLELICRTGANVDRFADMGRGNGTAKGFNGYGHSDFEKRTEGLRDFLDDNGPFDEGP